MEFFHFSIIKAKAQVIKIGSTQSPCNTISLKTIYLLRRNNIRMEGQTSPCHPKRSERGEVTELELLFVHRNIIIIHNVLNHFCPKPPQDLW
jgi:hypothetical protein